MNNAIVQYLQQNKDAFSKDSLIGELRKAGHSENDIMEGITIVYGNGSHIPLPPMGVNTIKYAGFWIRFLALFVDGIIVFAVSFPIKLLFNTVISVAGDGDSFALSFLLSMISFLISVTYYVGLTHKYRATWGKKLVGIEVRSDDNVSSASLGSIILRETVGKFVSGIILCVGYIMVAFTDKKQAAHDMIAKTVVVYK